MREPLLSLLIVLALVPSTARGQWSADGKDAADEPWRKTVNGFGAMVIFTDEPDAFVEAWQKPSSPDYKPTISSVDEVRRGRTVVAFVLFFNCKKDSSGSCNADVDFNLLRPDGTSYGDQDRADLWHAPPPPAGNLQLSRANLALRVEAQDPLGEYRLKAKVRDNVASIEVPLERKIRVLPTDGSPLIRSDEEFSAFMDRYYQSPRPDLVGSAIEFLGSHHVLEKSSAVPPVVSFFAVLFARNRAMLPEWTSIIERQPDEAKKALTLAIRMSEDPGAFVEAQPPSPSANDICWGAFLASGDIHYVARILDALRFMEERKDMNLFLTAASAKWSLASNAQRYPEVKAAVEAARATAEGARRRHLDEVLGKELSEHRREMESILREQHEKGIW